MTKLSVNLNKIALLRNSRGRDFPNLVQFGKMALDAGAWGLTIHPRPDQRHARYSDIEDLGNLIAQYRDKKGRDVELNIEGNPTPDFIDQVLKHKPHQCTLVPDDPNQLTSDHGYDLDKDSEFLKPIIDQMKHAGIRVSIFMDPAPESMEKAALTGADRIELYTEGWAQAFGTDEQESQLAQYRVSALAASKAGLEINAGHDLDLANLSTFLTIPDIAEVSIGHALTVEALYQGYAQVVSRYASICGS